MLASYTRVSRSKSQGYLLLNVFRIFVSFKAFLPRSEERREESSQSLGANSKTIHLFRLSLVFAACRASKESSTSSWLAYLVVHTTGLKGSKAEQMGAEERKNPTFQGIIERNLG